MQSSWTLKENSTGELIVTVDGDAWKKAQKKVFNTVKNQMSFKGFRKGQVPDALIRKQVGKKYLFSLAAEEVANDALTFGIEEQKIELVDRPLLDIKETTEEAVVLSFECTVSPEVTLGEYIGLDIHKDEVVVTDEDVENEVKAVQDRYADWVLKEEGQTAQQGDQVVIDFVGTLDGVPFEGGQGNEYPLELGSNTFIPGFEEQVIGMKAGDEKDLNVTFPEDYGAKDLAGAPVVFKVKVNEVKEKKTRELDEDFFEDLGMEGIDSEDKLKAEIKESIKAQKEMDAENKYVDSLLEGVSKNVEVDIPEEMVNEEVDRLMGRFAEQMKMQGISLDLYYQFTGSNEEQLRSQMEKEAFNNVLYRLMIEEIQQIEKIVVSDEDAEKEAEELAKKYQMDKEDFLNQFGGLEMVKYDLEVRKVIELLKELNK